MTERIDAKQIKDEYGISPFRLRELRREGKIPYRKMWHRTITYNREDIEAFVISCDHPIEWEESC